MTKIRYELVPDEMVDFMVAVLEAGIKKGYDENGWQLGKSFEKEKNIASIKRHLKDYRAGVLTDAESGLPTLWHAGTRCLMQAYLDLKKNQSAKNSNLRLYCPHNMSFDVVCETCDTGGLDV